MTQPMKNDKFFAIKLNTERKLLVLLILLSIILSALFVKQNSEIKQLKYNIAIQQSLNRNLEGRVDDLERQTNNFESKIEDIETRVENSKY